MNLHLLSQGCCKWLSRPKAQGGAEVGRQGRKRTPLATIQCCSEPDEARGHQVAESLAPVREAALSC